MPDKLHLKQHLKIEGTFNTRDIGGYVTQDGRKIRFRKLIRSDSLDKIPAKSQKALLDYGIRSIIDLRKSIEMQRTPNVFLGSDKVAYYHQNMVGDIRIRERESIPESLGYVEHMRWSYSVVLDKRQSQVRDTLSTLADPDTFPALIHCAGGTERTGLITALVLGIAGVPAETIAEDFAISAWFNFPRHLERNPEISTSNYTWKNYQEESSRPETMLAVLRTLDERHSGIEGYARNIGVSQHEIDSIRNALVE